MLEVVGICVGSGSYSSKSTKIVQKWGFYTNSARVYFRVFML